MFHDTMSLGSPKEVLETEDIYTSTELFTVDRLL